MSSDEAQGFPDDLVFSIAATDPECPEAHTLGPAGNEILRGNICVELSVQLLQPIGWTVGVPISAEGSSWAMLGFYRYEDPPLTVNTGDTGPGVGMPTGEVTIWSITPLADGSYEIEFSVAVSGDTEVLASGTITAVPDFCTAA